MWLVEPAQFRVSGNIVIAQCNELYFFYTILWQIINVICPPGGSRARGPSVRMARRSDADLPRRGAAAGAAACAHADASLVRASSWYTYSSLLLTQFHCINVVLVFYKAYRTVHKTHELFKTHILHRNSSRPRYKGYPLSWKVAWRS